MQGDAGCGSVGLCVAEGGSVLQCVAVYCSVLQCGTMCCIVTQCDAGCGSVGLCIAEGGSVSQLQLLQCVVVCCSILQTDAQAIRHAPRLVIPSTSRATAYPAFQCACARTRRGSKLRHCVLTSPFTLTNGSCHTHWVECVCAHAP